MRRSLSIAVFLIILSCILTGCSLSLPPPAPQKLMQILWEPFLCGFTGYDGAAEPFRAAFVRDESGDRLTVFGTSTDTVLFSDGTSAAILTRGNDDTPPLTLTLPADYSDGAAAFLPLFSVLPDASFTSSCCEGGILVTNTDGSYSAVFTAEGIPVRITDGTRTAVIDSFSAQNTPIP